MKKIVFIIIMISCCMSLISNENRWFSFWNDDNTLMGFKDSDGNVKITPKYVNPLSQGNFSNITIVIEKQIDGEYLSYYLTTSGKKIFKSIYMYDNSLDTESEGFIRFRDDVNDTVGMLDRHGNVVIPSVYNELQKVKNGLVVALRGAHKEYWDKHDESSCNHYSWSGGKIYLIDTSNRVLVEDYIYKSTYNLFTIKILTEPSEDPKRVNFLGIDGNYYSLIDHEKEFKEFVYNELLSDLSLENLIKNSYTTFSYRDDEFEKLYVSNKDLLTDNYSLISGILKTLQNSSTDFFITHQERKHIFYDDKRYDSLKEQIEKMEKTTYAHFVIYINHFINGEREQDQFHFLKIDNKYKLIDITLGSADLQL